MRLRKSKVLNSEDKLFLINIVSDSKSSAQLSSKKINTYNILAVGQFARVKIYQLEVK